MLFLYNISLRATVKMSFGCTADCEFNLTIKTWRRRKRMEPRHASLWSFYFTVPTQEEKWFKVLFIILLR